MSQAEALLSSLGETAYEHSHAIGDDDGYFVIDTTTRVISNATGCTVYLMQYDHNSETFTFELPLVVEGHDMSKCDQVKIHYNNVEGIMLDSDIVVASEAAYYADVHDADKIWVKDDKLFCAWVVSREATQFAGSLNFLVQYICTEDGTPVYEWHTDIFSDVVVKAGRNNGEVAVSEYTDILEQWRNKIFSAGDSVITDVAAAGEEQKALVAAKGEETLATIPDDYTTFYNSTNAALRIKAPAIVLAAEGESVRVADGSDDYLRGLTVYGKTTQDGTPTPDSPVELVSIESPTVNVCGLNLWDELTELGYWQSANGESYVVDDQIRSVNFIAISPETTLYVTAPNDKMIDFVFYDKNKEFLSAKSIAESIVSPSNAYYLHINLRSDYGTTYNNDVCISLTPLNGVYEPTKGAQSLALPYTLHALPVTSGGNYTDSSGQRWIANYVDFERGVYVQQIGVLTVPDEAVAIRFESYDGDGYYGWYYTDNQIRLGHNSYGNDIVSDRFVSAHTSNPQAINLIRAWCSVGNIYYTISSDSQEDANAAIRGALVYYILATPIETSLTDEELYAFSQLHSNYPTTTVLNDADAHMAVSYNADTKLYVDNKIQEAVDEYLSTHLL